MGDVHSAALEGFSREAAAYARGRPGYPKALIAWLREELRLAPGQSVLDLGAGTGKLTPLLQSTGARVVAVEPVEAMRAELVRHFPDVPAYAGTAQSIPLGDRQSDAVVCAQAFHWFATPDALAEIHRVLRPSGRLGLIWNVRDESVAWVAALTDILKPYELDTPRFRSGAWRSVFPSALFSDPEETVFAHGHVGEPEQVILARSLSVSFIAALEPGQKAEVERRIRSLIDTHPDLRGRASVAFPYRTVAYSCRRT
jgi:SAM-dependent methyltransferase